MLFLPFRIETLFRHYPVANWVIIGVTVLVHGMVESEIFPEDLLYAMILDGWNPIGLLGHLWLHGGFMHLAGNMIFLWVFGNAVCGNTSNRFFPLLYLGLGLAAAVTHLLIDGDSAVGASGAINGVVGMALAMYPLNRVSVFYWIWVRFGTFQLPLWVLALLWLAFDLVGATMRDAGVAYWAHIGGFFAGLGAGWLALRRGWVELDEIDHRSLEEILSGKSVEQRRTRLAAVHAPVASTPVTAPSSAGSGTAGATDPWQAHVFGDATPSPVIGKAPLVMPATARGVIAWINAAESAVASEEDQAVIDMGGNQGERRRFEVRYANTFLAMGYSFHRSLADYFRGVADGNIGGHERPALIKLLRIVENDFPAMCRCGFVDEELAGMRDEARLADFLRLGLRPREGDAST